VTTPHQRRLRELESRRRLVADCQSLIDSPGAIPATAVADIFEQHTSLLPANSQLRGQLERLALRLRRTPTVIAEAKLRRVVAGWRQEVEDFARQVERRDARLRERR
jgi:hypothetical protein